MTLFDYDLSDPLLFLAMIVFMFAVILLRYFAVAGVFFLYFYKTHPEKWKARKINLKQHPKKQFVKEIRWSMITALIFASSGALTALAWQKGYTAFYEEVEKYGWLYLIVSIPLLMIVHEVYYYFTHRLMHHPRLYKYVHKVHHHSTIPSPWTAFSFHPIEGIIEALILPLMLFVIPVHPYALLTYLMIMTISSVINHLDIEVYPAGWEKHWLGKWFIGASHHSLHHSQFKYNFGLYFTFLDKFFQTESPGFKSLFKSKTARVDN